MDESTIFISNSQTTNLGDSRTKQWSCVAQYLLVCSSFIQAREYVLDRNVHVRVDIVARI